jgi:predicted nucleic acid-binding protein
LTVVVDTSVWIQYLRGRDPTVKETMHRLLDEDLVTMAAPVRIELLSGVRSAGAGKLTRMLDAIPTFVPDRGTWTTMETWALRTASRGDRFGLGDLLIGALASEHSCAIWSMDTDFGRMAKLGLVELFG